MSFEVAHQWTLRCDGAPAGAGRCERRWTGWADTDQPDTGQPDTDDHDDHDDHDGREDDDCGVGVPVVILFDAPELVAGDREALAADGWLVCRDGSVLCPTCRQALGDVAWVALTNTPPASASPASTPPGGPRPGARS